MAASPRFRGGQLAADAALASWDVSGYARSRSGVWPPSRRGASGLSPYIRHGLLTLPTVWRAVDGGPAADVRKFRDELLWQEYARHMYARLGEATRRPLRREPSMPAGGSGADGGGHPPPANVDTDGATRLLAPVDEHGRWAHPWPAEMACMATVTQELHRDGWAVNQTRMWLPSQWTVRAGWDWREGDDELFAHLLDGSRAANRLGWQWTVGAGTGKPYGFSRWQVEKRAASLCKRCALASRCPIQDWPEAPAGERVEEHPALRRDPDLEATSGPRQAVRGIDRASAQGGGDREAFVAGGDWSSMLASGAPDAVWLTAESLGDEDPALAAHPELPAVFVFDAPLLARLRLSGKRLVFLTETLAELAASRPLELHLGDPIEVLSGRRVATTFAPVPGWRRRAAAIQPVELHPWPWLAWPRAGTLASYSAWRKQLGR